MSDQGRILSLDIMPVDKAGVCKVGIAQLYRKYRSMLEFDDEPRVFIERIFTRPGDAVSLDVIRALARTRDLAYELAYEFEHGDVTQGILEGLKAQIALCGAFDPNTARLDGRVGNLNYAKGAGLLEMCALWGWPIETISPRTWMSVMKNGAPTKLGPKDQSIFVAKQIWPGLFDKTQALHFYASERSNARLLDGLIEAALICEYGRRKLKLLPELPSAI